MVVMVNMVQDCWPYVNNVPAQRAGRNLGTTRQDDHCRQVRSHRADRLRSTSVSDRFIELWTIFPRGGFLVCASAGSADHAGAWNPQAFLPSDLSLHRLPAADRSADR